MQGFAMTPALCLRTSVCRPLGAHASSGPGRGRKLMSAVASAQPFPVNGSSTGAVESGLRGNTSPAPETLDLPKRTFIWRGHRTNYVTAGCGAPIVLVHGFGACAGHWKKNIAVLAKQGYKVYAIDLLGFGDSEKPKLDYCMELWRDQVLDFTKEFVQEPAVLVGNSIGSLVALMAAVEAPVRGLVLLNCVAAMNNKGLPKDDWRIVIASPIIALVDVLLKSQLAATLFEKYRTPDNIRSILSSVYRNQEAVDDELVQMLYRPSCDPGALDVFVSVLTGPPGPRPWDVTPQTSAPLLVLWGDRDPFTPVDGPSGKYYEELAKSGQRANLTFRLLNDVGHCPHDDRPDEVHQHLLPWLKQIYTQGTCEVPQPVQS